MGFISDIFGGGSETVTQQTILTPEQKALINRQVKLADIQIAEIGRQRKAQAETFGQAEDAAGQVDEFIAGQQGLGDEAQRIQLEQLQAGGEATPRETELINQAIEQALRSGEADISRFQSQSTEQLREELAPQLGLRPGDTPILDRGSRIAAESNLQQGQLVRGLRGQQAQSLLNFPLARTQVIGGQAGALAQFQSALQSQLQQSAFTNRLQLAGARSTAGLGLAGVSTPNIGPAFSGLGSTESSDTGAGFGEIAGGIGATLLGLGAVGIGSSRDIKDIDGMVDEEAVLEALKTLDVGVWNYKGETEKHIGAFAEDFQEAFGVGDGKTISIIDAIGVLTASMKALANREMVNGAA